VRRSSLLGSVGSGSGAPAEGGDLEKSLDRSPEVGEQEMVHTGSACVED